jgi:hypothetical protein
VLPLEKSHDFATELNDFVRVAKIFAALVIKTKAGGILEGIWDDSLHHLPNRELSDFFAEEFKVLLILKSRSTTLV